MPAPRPTIADLDERLRTTLASRLEGTDPLLRKSYVATIGRAVAGLAHGLYGRIEYAERQLFPATADEDALLELHAPLRGIPRKAGEEAVGMVSVTGADGAVIPEGRVLTRSDGMAFEVQTETAIAGGSASVPVRAVDPTAAANTPAGASLSFISPLANVASSGTVLAPGITGGSDVEPIERLRERVVARWRRPAQGGALHDYIAWALEVAGVTRVWPVREAGGSVTVRYVTDDEADIIPSPAHVALVQAHLESVRPITAEVIALAPVATPLDFEIQLAPNTPTVQAAVTAELNDLLTRLAAPGATLLISKIREAVSIAAGEGNNVVVAPAADVSHAAGEIATLGSIAFAEIE